MLGTVGSLDPSNINYIYLDEHIDQLLDIEPWIADLILGTLNGGLDYKIELSARREGLLIYRVLDDHIQIRILHVLRSVRGTKVGVELDNRIRELEVEYDLPARITLNSKAHRPKLWLYWRGWSKYSELGDNGEKIIG